MNFCRDPQPSSARVHASSRPMAVKSISARRGASGGKHVPGVGLDLEVLARAFTLPETCRAPCTRYACVFSRRSFNPVEEDRDVKKWTRHSRLAGPRLRALRGFSVSASRQVDVSSNRHRPLRSTDLVQVHVVGEGAADSARARLGEGDFAMRSAGADLDLGNLGFRPRRKRSKRLVGRLRTRTAAWHASKQTHRGGGAARTLSSRGAS